MRSQGSSSKGSSDVFGKAYHSGLISSVLTFSVHQPTLSPSRTPLPEREREGKRNSLDDLPRPRFTGVQPDLYRVIPSFSDERVEGVVQYLAPVDEVRRGQA